MNGHADLGNGGFPFVFMTENLNATLQNVAWTVHYRFWFSGIRRDIFRFGNSAYDGGRRTSRMELHFLCIRYLGSGDLVHKTKYQSEIEAPYSKLRIAS